MSANGPRRRLVEATNEQRRRPAIAATPGDHHDPRLLTTQEVADRFRTSPSTVRYWRHTGQGPKGVLVGRHVLYDEAECDRWFQAKKAAQNGSSPTT